MKIAHFTLILLLGFLSISCGSDSVLYPPGATKLTVNKTERTLEWDSVAGATSYNLYLRTITGCPDVNTATPELVDKNDPKLENVISPFDITDYLTCGTCYWGALASVNEKGESILSNTKGWGPSPASCP